MSVILLKSEVFGGGMNEDYSRLLLVNHIINQIFRPIRKSKLWIKNRFKSFLMEVCNLSKGGRDPVFGHLRKSLVDVNKYMDGLVSKDMVKQIRDSYVTYMSKSIRPKTSLTEGEYEYVASFGKYKRNLPKDQIRILLGLGCSEEEIIRMTIRYCSLISEFRSRSFVRSTYDKIYQLGFRVEGFASPFNSKMLAYDDCNYCSLFQDDFKSLGSFFDLKLSDINVVCFPPRSPGVYNMVIDELSDVEDNTRILLLMDAWEDIIDRVRQMASLTHVIEIPSNTIMTEDDSDLDEDGRPKTTPMNVKTCLMLFDTTRNQLSRNDIESIFLG